MPKTTVLIASDAAIRFGYEAPFCSVVNTIIEVRFVTVETEISAAWKWFTIHWLVRKRFWK
jgi:hypothetical protein